MAFPLGILFILAGTGLLAYDAVRSEKNGPKSDKHGARGGGRHSGNQPGADDKPLHGNGGISHERVVNPNVADRAGNRRRNRGSRQHDAAADNRQASAVISSEEIEDEIHTKEHTDASGRDNASHVRGKSGSRKKRGGTDGGEGDAGNGDSGVDDGTPQAPDVSETESGGTP
jgi:hypothetical protein